MLFVIPAPLPNVPLTDTANRTVRIPKGSSPRAGRAGRGQRGVRDPSSAAERDGARADGGDPGWW